MPRKQSSVWKAFVKTDGGGQCKFCNKDIKSVNTTTNLMKHLARAHPRLCLRTGDNKLDAHYEPEVIFSIIIKITIL